MMVPPNPGTTPMTQLIYCYSPSRHPNPLSAAADHSCRQVRNNQGFGDRVDTVTSPCSPSGDKGRL